MYRLIVLALGLAAMPAFAAPKPVNEAWNRAAPVASGAWVRLNPVPGRPSAGYLTITGGGQPETLTGATAPGVRIELHSMSMDGGIMKMAALDKMAVPAGATLAFAPGGNHLMIFGLAANAKSLPITLVFASGGTLTTTALIKPAGAADHAGH